MPLLYEQSRPLFRAFAGASTKLTAIRVQDVTTHKWYNWDNGSWDSNGTPKCTPGGNLYVAAYAVNEGDPGTAGIKVTYIGYSQENKGYLETNQGIGIEVVYTMPLQGNAQIELTDSSKSTYFTVANLSGGGGGTEIPWTPIIGAAVAIVGVTAVAAVLTRRGRS